MNAHRWWGCVVVFGASVAGCSSSSNGAGGEASDGGGVVDASTTPATPASHANGTLTSWTTAAPIPTPRANHCAVVANGFLVVIGGNYKPAGQTEFVNIADVHVARISAEGGSLGEWKLAGKTPSPVNSCTAASDGKDVYLVDGIFDDDSAGSKVRRATLSDSGELGAWQELGALPTGDRVLYSNATVTSGHLLAFDARLPGAGNGIALLGAPVTASSNAVGAWQTTTWLTGFRGHPQYAFATVGSASYVYVLGGYSSGDTGSTVLADGAGAALDASGIPGKSFVVTSLPKPTSFGQAIAIDDYVFVIGGKDGVLDGAGSAAVYVAKIGASGALGAWSTAAALPQGRTSLAVASSGDYLFVTGGGFDAGGLDTVFTARVRF